MSTLNRRNALRAGAALAIPPGIATLIAGCNSAVADDAKRSNPSDSGALMKVHYLEIVTPEADALCEQYSKVHGITFSEPDVNLGGARIAKVDGGGFLAIRGPLRDTETPVVRPYVLVDDIKAAVKAAAEAGAEVALPPMELPQHGTCAIVIHGGIECGFWQNA